MFRTHLFVLTCASVARSSSVVAQGPGSTMQKAAAFATTFSVSTYRPSFGCPGRPTVTCPNNTVWNYNGDYEPPNITQCCVHTDYESCQSPNVTRNDCNVPTLMYVNRSKTYETFYGPMRCCYQGTDCRWQRNAALNLNFMKYVCSNRSKIPTTDVYDPLQQTQDEGCCVEKTRCPDQCGENYVRTSATVYDPYEDPRGQTTCCKEYRKLRSCGTRDQSLCDGTGKLLAAENRYDEEGGRAAMCSACCIGVQLRKREPPGPSSRLIPVQTNNGVHTFVYPHWSSSPDTYTCDGADGACLAVEGSPGVGLRFSITYNNETIIALHNCTMPQSTNVTSAPILCDNGWEAFRGPVTILRTDNVSVQIIDASIPVTTDSDQTCTSAPDVISGWVHWWHALYIPSVPTACLPQFVRAVNNLSTDFDKQVCYNKQGLIIEPVSDQCALMRDLCNRDGPYIHSLNVDTVHFTAENHSSDGSFDGSFDGLLDESDGGSDGGSGDNASLDFNNGIWSLFDLPCPPTVSVQYWCA